MVYVCTHFTLSLFCLCGLATCVGSACWSFSCWFGLRLRFAWLDCIGDDCDGFGVGYGLLGWMWAGHVFGGCFGAVIC